MSDRFDIKKFNQLFEENIFTKQKETKIAEEQKLAQLNQEIIETNPINKSIEEIMIGTKDTWMNLFNLKLIEHSTFYFGTTLICFAIIMILLNLVGEN